ncbi:MULTISPECIES: bifunctional DNA primase/helicase [Rhizobium]|uniref:DNA primase/helicase n=1 Tax=Rhizobium favelukesii TaxID=348824 RepID=W6RPK9_9HYPH|nr:MULTISPECIES: bifunctional DNA primase/helicase [Rhizobium]MCS0462981.1 AAA family ATPase [Rhizobium favelukesii]UFS82056.1 AAA family ATPase [Rhizobium sp. T136]CDM56271.1 DNA primase/helicase [Rhizobium favelukesii]
MTTKLGQIGVQAFVNRKIDPNVAALSGAYTGKAVTDADGQTVVEPDVSGNIVVFPFIDGGRAVAEKYRAPGKKFWQRKNGRKTFWNADCMDDPALEDGHKALIITEGEIDALTSIDCGFHTTVSVPDGAPPVRDGEDPDQVEDTAPEDDSRGKFEFVFNNRHRIKRIKRFILAVDNDGPGRRLAAELVRRIGAARCSFVTYPEGCKDLNDVRMNFGPDAVVRVLTEAKPYPVKGIYLLSDYPELDEPRTYSTGWPDLDPYLRVWLGELLVVTGIPGHGKSTWTMNMCVNLARANGWRIGVASFEIPTVPALRYKLRLAASGVESKQWNRDIVADADVFIQKHFVFIDADPTGDADDDMTLEWLLERAADAVLRHSIRVLVIDPWNEVEHYRPRNESETQYINRALRQIRRFALKYEVLAIVVAHPTKELGKGGEARTPTLYDIEGSAAWYNKPDHGVVIDVPDPDLNETVVWVKKARFSWSGRKGDVTLQYLPEVEGYQSLNGFAPMWKAAQAEHEYQPTRPSKSGAYQGKKQ